MQISHISFCSTQHAGAKIVLCDPRWKKNVDHAHELNQSLHVFYFEARCGSQKGCLNDIGFVKGQETNTNVSLRAF